MKADLLNRKLPTKLFLLLTLALIYPGERVVANDLDVTLKEIILSSDLRPLEPVKPRPSELTRLGAMLYHDGALSGNGDTNCVSCHHPRFGTSDAIPFSIGTGGRGMGSHRQQRNAGVTKRHSPHLLNIGYEEIDFMFWDGRVHRDQKTGILTTPEPALNGANPARKDIASVMTMAASVQTIFPIVNSVEMMGENNDISKAFKEGGNLKAWDAIMTRLLTGTNGSRYLKEFKKAFPNANKFNIGHVGEALGAFMGRSFNVINTPYDSYLKGNSTALTPAEKRGFILFTTKANCISCHNGPHLADGKFHSIAIPQFNEASIKAPYDLGRFEATGKKEDQFKFRTPTLRNLAATAPYMHNGAFSNLDQVVEHFADPQKSIEDFDLTNVDLSNYSSQFVVDRDPVRNQQRVDSIPIPSIRQGIKLTEEEKKDLVQFLETGLLDYRFQPQRLRN